MREIKYRQRLKTRFAKLVGSPYHYWGYIENEFVSSLGEFETIGESEQYTGIKDKNGVEIYEGDIISEPVSSVSGKDRGYLYKNRVVEWLGADSGYGLFNTHVCSEVIGNIHDNPELLERAE